MRASLDHLISSKRGRLGPIILCAGVIGRTIGLRSNLVTAFLSIPPSSILWWISSWPSICFGTVPRILRSNGLISTVLGGLPLNFQERCNVAGSVLLIPVPCTKLLMQNDATVESRLP